MASYNNQRSSLLYIAFLGFQSHMSAQALTSNRWKELSALPLSSCIWVGAPDMLSEVSAPHGDRHHHHRLPLPPPCLTVPLCLELCVFPSVDGAGETVVKNDDNNKEKNTSETLRGEESLKRDKLCNKQTGLD